MSPVGSPLLSPKKVPVIAAAGWVRLIIETKLSDRPIVHLWSDFDDLAGELPARGPSPGLGRPEQISPVESAGPDPNTQLSGTQRHG